MNRKSHGVLPVAIVGSATFDVTQVDLATVRLARADGVGGGVAPHEGPPGPHSVLDDVATPFGGEPCDCSDTAGDGVVDWSLKFETDELVQVLQLDSLAGSTTVELVLSGRLRNGSEFAASDCVVLVPGNSPPSSLFVRSTAPGAWFDVAPKDPLADEGGFTVPEFARAYPAGTVVTLTASEGFRGRSLKGWRINGQMQSSSNPVVIVLISGVTEAVAEYSVPGDFDLDGDTDLDDYDAFESCLALSGPGAGSPNEECLDSFDFDNDLDVDLKDVGGFQNAFSSPSP